MTHTHTQLTHLMPLRLVIIFFAMAYSGFYGKADIAGVAGSRSGKRMIRSSSDNVSLEG